MAKDKLAKRTGPPQSSGKRLQEFFKLKRHPFGFDFRLRGQIPPWGWVIVLCVGMVCITLVYLTELE